MRANNSRSNILRSTQAIALLLLAFALLAASTATAGLNPEASAQAAPAASNPESLTPWKPRPVLGPQKTLVLLVEFQNVRFRNSLVPIRSLMDTVDQWFRRASYGKMYIDYTIDEQVLTLPNIMADYGAPASGDQRGDAAKRTQAYFYDALIMIPDTVLSQFKHVILIHAGGDEAITGDAYDIWSMCDCSGPIADEDPENEATWVITDESGRITHAFWGVSTFSEDEHWAIPAHEFAHSLGISDLYIYGSDGYSEGEGVGFWSNMATGTYLAPPSDIDGWSKYILGWIDAVRVDSPQGEQTIYTLDSSNEPKALIVPIIGRSDYYFVHARRRAGTDAGLPSEGVIVFRINPYREVNLRGQELALLSDANPTTPTECYLYENSFQDLCQSLDAPYNLRGREYGFMFSSLSATIVLNNDAFWAWDAGVGFKVAAAGDDAFRITFAASAEELGISPTETTTTTQTTVTPRCLIATAAYGSEMASEVVRMRFVRDDLIASSPLGRMLVDAFNSFYYSWSPPVAQLIASDHNLRGAFRVLLKPIGWVVSIAALGFGFVLDLTRNGDLASAIAFLTAAMFAVSLYIGLPILAVAKVLPRRKKER